MKQSPSALWSLVLAFTIMFCAGPVQGQGTAFTYQGRLADGTGAVNGSYDLRFTLVDAGTGGNQVGGAFTNTATAVSNGLFNVTLDFGINFPGADRWLEIGVCTNGGGVFTTLNPRQKISVTPYAIRSATASSADTAATVSNASITANKLSAGAGANGQVLKMSGGVLAWSTDLNSGGTLTSVSTGTGLTGGPVTTSGTLSIDTNVVPRLGVANTFSGTNMFTGSNIFNGAIRATNGSNFFVGTFAGDGSGLTNLNGGALAAGSISSSALANGSITTAHLAPGAVSSLGAADGSPVTALSVDNAGLVGIGTTNPVAGLEITAGAAILAPQRLFQVKDETGGYTNLAEASSVAISGTLLAISGYSDSGVTVVNIANPARATLLSQFRDSGGTFTNLAGARGVAMQSNLLAIAASTDHAVTLVTLTNPAAPMKLAEMRDGIGGWNELAGAFSVAISGNLLAIAANIDNAVTLVDISNPSAPIKRAELKDEVSGYTNLAGARDVALANNLLAIASYVDDAVTLVDVSDPANPIKRAELRDNIGGYNYLDGPYAVALSGGLLAIASIFEDAVTLVNVTDPANPVMLAEIRNGLGGVTTLDGAVDVAISSNQLAVAATFSDAVTLFDISNPSAPRQTAVIRDNVSVNYLAKPYGVAFVGTRFAVAAESALTLVSFTSAEAGLVSQGWVGIGTDSPAAALHVVGNMVVESSWLFDINSDRIELGIDTTASGLSSTAMGAKTTAIGDNSTAIGLSTTASGSISTAMGSNTTASGVSSTAIGSSTTAGGSASTAMGYSTTASGDYSTAMGYGTTASGVYSTAMGFNTAAKGDYSTAMGSYVSATNSGSFVWGDASTSAGLTSTNNNSVTMRAIGGYRLFSNTNATAGVSLAPGGTAWATLSDRAAKKNFQPLDDKEVLEKLAAIPIQRWNYNWESDNDVPHIGPVAQDFKRAFYPGRDETSITTLEFDGVALAAIKGLNQKLETTRAELKRKDAENAELKRRLLALEKAVFDATVKSERR